MSTLHLTPLFVSLSSLVTQYIMLKHFISVTSNLIRFCTFLAHVSALDITVGTTAFYTTPSSRPNFHKQLVRLLFFFIWTMDAFSYSIDIFPASILHGHATSYQKCIRHIIILAVLCFFLLFPPVLLLVRNVAQLLSDANLSVFSLLI